MSKENKKPVEAQRAEKPPAPRPFMKLAGKGSGPADLSTRKGFSKGSQAK
ncbi:MAG: hypothetical protein ABI824_11730 [Acidobacteriota bacterium]